MRVAHITDLHVEVRPHITELFNKRLMGVTNLYLLGRHAHFSPATVTGLVSAVSALAPDAVVCTGDLTSTATEAEFQRAAEVLRPLTDRFPFVVQPGNHDVYTDESVGRFAKHFGAFANGGRFPFVWPVGPIDFVLVDSARPDWLSRGRVGDDQLEVADMLLGAGDRPAVVMLHYPLRDRKGAPYGPPTRNLSDAASVEKILTRHARVTAVLHGHAHHGYRTEIPGPRLIPSLNPGASGYAWLPKHHRTAHFNVYEFAADGTFAVERHAWDGTRFAPEAGGAYATGG